VIFFISKPLPCSSQEWLKEKKEKSREKMQQKKKEELRKEKEKRVIHKISSVKTAIINHARKLLTIIMSTNRNKRLKRKMPSRLMKLGRKGRQKVSKQKPKKGKI